MDIIPESEDKMYLLIVEEQEKEIEERDPTVKEELVDQIDEQTEVDDIFQKVKELGECIEFDESTLYSKKVKLKLSHNNYHNNQCTGDRSFLLDNELHFDASKKNAINLKRTKYLPPEKQYSTVQELCNQIPELYENQDALISTLVLKMRAITRPPLPVPYYKLTRENKYECTKCRRLTDSEPASGRHYAEYHGPRYLKCLACGADFRSNTNLYKHEKRCVAPDAKLVLIARAMYLGRKGRSRPFLQKDFDVGKHLKHMNGYIVENGLFSVTSVLEPILHTLLLRGIYQLTVTPSSSVTTAAGHSNIALLLSLIYELMKCPRRFSTNFALRLHVRREHLKLPPPCACKLCPRRYPRMSLLSAHMKRVHGVTLMTRNMFLKRLPLLSNMEVKEAAVVLNNELDCKMELEDSF
ncbi:hypothetical protein EVAR_43056_1 [Eumeta japonica]|uniref:C2H2-type domain-containing protein n=1 Tax=Eumeta variegata TaxID=151549 RepID=A0A4C1WXB9_EUMVA|nr:hypothetical protein EVAR_43056_1 [Eumeta japonica]